MENLGVIIGIAVAVAVAVFFGTRRATQTQRLQATAIGLVVALGMGRLMSAMLFGIILVIRQWIVWSQTPPALAMARAASSSAELPLVQAA